MRSVAELISKRDETANEVDPKPPHNDTGNAFGDGFLNSKSKATDVYPLWNQSIVSALLQVT